MKQRYRPDIGPEALLNRFIDRHVHCTTCVHGIDQDLFGNVFCDLKDSISGGWNPGMSYCEDHEFSDSLMEATLGRLMNAHYAMLKKQYPEIGNIGG